MSETTPTKNFTLKPDGKVNTTWAVIGSIIAATAVLVGGLMSIKSDIAAATKEAQQSNKEAQLSQQMVRELRDDILRLRIALGVFDVPSSVAKPPTKERQP